MRKSALVTAILIATAPLTAGQAQQNTNDRQNHANEDDGGQNGTYVDVSGRRVLVDDDDDGGADEKDSNAFREVKRPPLPNDNVDENDGDDLAPAASGGPSPFIETSGRVAPGTDPATSDNDFVEVLDRQSTSSDDENDAPSNFGELQGRQTIGDGNDDGDDSNVFGEQQGRQMIGDDGGGDDEGDSNTFGEQQGRQTIGDDDGDDDGGDSNTFGEQQGRQTIGNDGGGSDDGGNVVGEQHHATSGAGSTLPDTVLRLRRGLLIGGNGGNEDELDDVTFFGDLQGRQAIGDDGDGNDDGGGTVGEQHHSAPAQGGKKNLLSEARGRIEHGPGGLVYEAPPVPFEADRDDQILLSTAADEAEAADQQDEVQDYVELSISGRPGAAYALLAVLDRDAPAVLVAAGELFNDTPSGSINVYLPRTDSKELPTVILIPLGS